MDNYMLITIMCSDYKKIIEDIINIPDFSEDQQKLLCNTIAENYAKSRLFFNSKMEYLDTVCSIYAVSTALSSFFDNTLDIIIAYINYPDTKHELRETLLDIAHASYEQLLMSKVIHND